MEREQIETNGSAESTKKRIVQVGVEITKLELNRLPFQAREVGTYRSFSFDAHLLGPHTSSLRGIEVRMVRRFVSGGEMMQTWPSYFSTADVILVSLIGWMTDRRTDDLTS